MGLPVRKELQSPVRYADYSLAAVGVMVALLGIAMNYSSTWRQLEFDGGDPAFFAKRQALFVAVGLIAMAVTATVDYRVFHDYAAQAYLVVAGSLVAVLFFGREVNGARAWFELPGLAFQIQPAEFAKLAVILSLASFVANKEGYLKVDALVNALLLVAVPMGLIFVQPDIGTMLVFVAIAMGMLLVAGAQVRHIVVTTLIGVIVIIAVFNVDDLGGPALLRETQENRLTAFLDPDFDPSGASYNLQQAQIAVGAGGLTGRGWLEGTQTGLDLVPEQQTDFIFTALAEEFGFVGGALLLAAYAYMLFRIWRIAHLSRDLFGTFVCVGVLSMFLFQIFQNIGMTIGIMPITGIPLPFMSHGGSSTVAAFIGLGLVLNVGARRHSP